MISFGYIVLLIIEISVFVDKTESKYVMTDSKKGLLLKWHYIYGGIPLSISRAEPKLIFYLTGLPGTLINSCQ
ncbi:MAG TPA: hypothetical protein DEG09_06745 [Marinilabiliaceae bacterium]|nr:hypothetical protein [Marinilabiliaceae bacterium]